MNSWRALVLLLCLMIANMAFGENARPGLSPAQASKLRNKLDRLFFEQDLMVRNQKVDRSDLRHQEREFETLKVFERIPFREELPELEAQLRDTALNHGLKLLEFKPLPRERRRPPALPSTLLSDTHPTFAITPAQLTEQIPFSTQIQGSREQALAWVQGWSEEQLRLTEPQAPSDPLRKLGPNRWEVRAHAFRFREIKYPSLQPRDPMELLPGWARRNPARFEREQPQLWNLILRTRAVSPKARPLYRVREAMLLNDARMSFFLAHAATRP